MSDIKKAVTLKYPENAPAPFVTSVTKGKLAEEVLKAAKNNDIIIVENEPLTEILCAGDIGTYVPEETWLALAEIFTFVLGRESETVRRK